MKLVSIIIPVYNSEKYIARCIESIINQSYKNIEIICIDDGSSDNSIYILNKYKNKDRRITIYSQENKGPSVARNIGLDKATGEYILFIDADDYVNKDMIRIMVQSINTKLDTIVFCDNSELWNDKIDERKLFKDKNNGISKMDVIKEISSGNAGLVCAKLFTRKIVENNNIRFDSNISMCEDQLFFLNVAKKCNTFIHIPKSLYFYDRRNENSITIKYHQNALENQLYVLKEIEKILYKCNLNNKDIKLILNNRYINAIHYSIINEVLDTKLSNVKEKIQNVKKIVLNEKLKQVISDIIPNTIIEKIISRNFDRNRYILLFSSFYILYKVIIPLKKSVKKLIIREKNIG